MCLVMTGQLLKQVVVKQRKPDGKKFEPFLSLQVLVDYGDQVRIESVSHRLPADHFGSKIGQQIDIPVSVRSRSDGIPGINFSLISNNAELPGVRQPGDEGGF